MVRRFCVWGHLNTVLRYDQGELRGTTTRTEEGYIRGDAIVTRTGVFIYRNADGSIRRELRHPDDVFERASLDSLRMIPITNRHPSEKMVDATNADRLSIGQTGENVTVDGRFVHNSLTVTHADGVATIEAGGRGLSLGYGCDIEETAGVYDGEPYDVRQRNIRYNHLAINVQARAGVSARINLDGADAIQVTDAADGGKDDHSQQEESMADMKLVAVRVDGIDYEAPPEVAREIGKLQERVDGMGKDLDAAKADAEKAKARLDEATAELDKAKETRTDEAIREAAKARIGLERKALHLVEIKSDELDDLSDRQVMEKVITTKHDSVDLTGKSDEYVAARFDHIVETTPQRDPDAIKRQLSATTERVDGEAEKEDGDKKKKEGLDAMKNAHKRDKSANK